MEYEHCCQDGERVGGKRAGAAMAALQRRAWRHGDAGRHALNVGAAPRHLPLGHLGSEPVTLAMHIPLNGAPWVPCILAASFQTLVATTSW